MRYDVVNLVATIMRSRFCDSLIHSQTYFFGFVVLVVVGYIDKMGSYLIEDVQELAELLVVHAAHELGPVCLIQEVRLILVYSPALEVEIGMMVCDCFGNMPQL